MNNLQKITTKNDITTLVLEYQTLRFCCTFRYLTDTFRQLANSNISIAY